MLISIIKEAFMNKTFFFLSILILILISFISLNAIDMDRVNSWVDKECKGKKDSGCTFKVMLQLRQCLEKADYNKLNTDMSDNDFKRAEDECFHQADRAIDKCK